MASTDPAGPAHAKMLRLAAANERRLYDLARGVPPCVEPTLADLAWIGSKRPTAERHPEVMSGN